MQAILSQVEQQLAFNAGKNLLCEAKNSTFGFLDFSEQAVKELAKVETSQTEEIIRMTTAKVLDQLYQTNQYYHFEQAVQSTLEQIYRQLFAEVRNALTNKTQDWEKLEKRHYLKLQTWLKQSNPFACQIYPDTQPLISQSIVCAEYTPETQMSILCLSLPILIEPILNVGCGKNALLVRYLQNQGFDVYGLDRSVPPASYLNQLDWLHFTFQPDVWGTVISHLGFSNHFVHHHLRQDGDYLAYAQKYMEILRSLKKGGSFHYAPDLSFIETYLNPAEFTIHHHPIIKTTYKATRIIKK